MKADEIRQISNKVGTLLEMKPAVAAPNGIIPVMGFIAEIAAQLAEGQVSLRDRIAIAAMQGYITCDTSGKTFWSTSDHMVENAKNAYAWADAMILAREEKK